MTTPTIDVESTTQAVTVHQPSEVGAALPAEQSKPPVTAAQAKIDAVASLTMKAYERAATLQITAEETAKLSADFPDEAFKPGASGKEHLIYTEHAYLRDRLSDVFGMGQWAIIPRNRWAEEFTTARGAAGSRVYVEAMLVIRGCFVAEAVGAMEYYPKNESQNYGDAVEGAKTAAFRRCAKELGVGLQAWKKDWCEGWWSRRKAPRSNPPRQQPATGSGQRVSTQPKPTPTPPKANSAPNLAKPVQAAIFADEQTLTRMIRELKDCEALAVEFFTKLSDPSVLLPGETLADVPLQFVPVTKRQFQLLMAAIGDFGNGGDAVHPFPANPLPPAKEKKERAPAAKTVPASEVPSTPSVAAAKAKDPEWFWDVFITVPRKGMTKAEYDRSPDTIRSLYDAMKAGDQDAQRRLWGLAKNWDCTPREYNGKTYPPTDADRTCRSALDAFCDWETKHGKDTKSGPQDVPRGSPTAQEQIKAAVQAAAPEAPEEIDVPF